MNLVILKSIKCQKIQPHFQNNLGCCVKRK